MKIIHAKGALRIRIIWMAGLSIIFMLFDVVAILYGESGGVSLLVGCGCFYMPLLIFSGLWIYHTHWIQYGKGKIIIRRVSKKRINGIPKGKWENREDEFLVEDIEAYGLSEKIFGYSVERHRCSARYDVECFFQLKGGRKIGFEMICYLPTDMEELFNYIFEETGLEFQPPEIIKRKKKKSRK